jgi:release factor glutamine methyltransferase
MIAAALAAARARLAAAGVPEPGADAEVLLADVLGTNRAGLVVRAREPLACAAEDRFARLLARRAAREPVAYILGEREFWSLPLRVDRRVLIPRPETELVVSTALRLAPAARRVLDVGTGSGAIAVALARELPRATIVATDRMAPALAVAAVNRARLAPQVALLQADGLGPFGTGVFDLVVANPPYCVEGAVVQAEVRDWEPETALYAGPDGLDVIAALVDEAPRVLVPGGWLVLEMGLGQVSAVAERVRATGRYDRLEVVPDLAGIERVAAARVDGGG